jgi:hypothetical protein
LLFFPKKISEQLDSPLIRAKEKGVSFRQRPEKLFDSLFEPFVYLGK